MRTLVSSLALLLLLSAERTLGQFPAICAGNCLSNGAFTNSCAMPVTTSDGCTTWSGDCSGWFISHGAPQESQNSFWVVEGKSPCVNVNSISLVHETGPNPDFPGNGGSGIYTNYPFTTGQSYDVRIIYTFAIDFFIPNRGVNGMLNVVAANNLRPAPLAGCRGMIPTSAVDPGLTLQQIKAIPLSVDGGSFDQVFTFTANGSYSQFWIYPQGANFGPSSNPNIRMTVLSVFVCPHCPTNTNFYNSGSIPTSASAGSIFIGTSAVDGGNGSGTVTVQSAQATQLTATNLIQIDKNFTAAITGAGIVNFSIAPCTSPGNSPRPDLFDSTDNLGAFFTIQSLAVDSTVLTAKPRAFTDPAPADPLTIPLQVYPTISSGAFTVTGSAADLANANLLVVDESGRTVYRVHNDAGTTVNLNLGKLGNGLYFLQINNGSKVTTQRIIINK